ncbi:hypothetical protein MPTK1_3g21550 [Marchantia polymorpha subsp. ruderalis]|uniref:Uncharacterized protein n=2 Tax=Marchantia polymorpha TaxID=3197 RepID=A0AAF6B398_MARPO|nr:hypothetical protein MARPO_0089s0061 [Marchantia polymorpha]BBN06482.1 hypothetical protein Mp_3g21550 [Marchantia polymorpha subsp. ruderalis]|eukprot:PTQ33437.1 hypothetical protein MARPO_0089s0061 [Marchantia polymorpha]
MVYGSALFQTQYREGLRSKTWIAESEQRISDSQLPAYLMYHMKGPVNPSNSQPQPSNAASSNPWPVHNSIL